jgi:hypothetical protein
MLWEWDGVKKGRKGLGTNRKRRNKKKIKIRE